MPLDLKIQDGYAAQTMTNDNRFYRNELLIGTEAQGRLRNAHVVVFGLGGVGSYCVEGLARAGIGALTLVDFDTIGLTNLNRQIMATTATIGQEKPQAMADRVLSINPDCRVTPIRSFFDREQLGALLSQPFDLVVDAIDSFNPKITLIVEALARGYRLLSSMGAAAKIDPTCIRVTDLAKTEFCPFARRIRKRLRTHGIKGGFQVVWSTEVPILPFHPDEVKTDTREVTLKRGRPRMVQGSIGYITGIFGMTLAGLAIREITGLKTARETPAGARESGKALDWVPDEDDDWTPEGSSDS